MECGPVVSAHMAVLETEVPAAGAYDGYGSEPLNAVQPVSPAFIQPLRQAARPSTVYIVQHRESWKQIDLNMCRTFGSEKRLLQTGKGLSSTVRTENNWFTSGMGSWKPTFYQRPKEVVGKGWRPPSPGRFSSCSEERPLAQVASLLPGSLLVLPQPSPPSPACA